VSLHGASLSLECFLKPYTLNVAASLTAVIPRTGFKNVLKLPLLPVNHQRLTLRNGRTLAWREYGPTGGQPVLSFQGTPGSRFSRHADEGVYDRLRVRLIVFDRPGYGASSRLPGRGLSIVADDAAELLDHLTLESVHVTGGSGGGPHALAFAARHPDRVRAASVVVGAAPIVESDLDGLIQINQDGWYAAHEGWDALYGLLAPFREALLADPLAGFRDIMKVAPPSDKAVMDDTAWQRVLVESVSEALRPGAEGWVDEGMAIILPWDFDPALVGCSLTWWHGEHDANAPIASVRRLLAGMDGVELRLWESGGHLEPYHRYEEIVTELLGR
jgi:pimeloyl-ACP methyl ester carboxylesterase